MTNLFIGLSNNQVLSYTRIVKDLSNQNNILITNNTIPFDKHSFSQVIIVDRSFNNQSSGLISSIKNILQKIKSYKLILKKINHLRKEERLTLYFTYIEDILTNYLLFSFNKNIQGIVVEDGTLNYYSHTIHNLSKKKIWAKKILCYLNGIPFKFYKGHSSGIEYDHVVKQYVKSPDLALFPKKSVQLDYSKKKVELNKSILIIGQEAYINTHGLNLYLERLNKIFSYVLNQPFYDEITKIYYKPHRNGARINYTLLDSKFAAKEIIVLNSDLPLEDLYFQELKSKYIFGFDSSVFLNLYLESDETSKEEINFNVFLYYNKELRYIFEKFDFNIVE